MLLILCNLLRFIFFKEGLTVYFFPELLLTQFSVLLDRLQAMLKYTLHLIVIGRNNWNALEIVFSEFVRFR